MQEDKNIALKAFAGSGKTRALTLRFLSLYLKGEDLSSIYAITFTNKATAEMKQRIEKYLQDIPQKTHFINNLSDLHISTIHSFLYSILSTIPFESEIMPNFEIIEDQQAEEILDQVIDEFFEQKDAPEIIKNITDIGVISIKKRLKHLFLSLLPDLPMIRDKSDEDPFFSPLLLLFNKFEKRKRQLNVLTYSDLEYYALRVLKDSQTREYLYFKSTSKIKHLLIDEFQDTSITQWNVLSPIAREVTSGAGSLFYVGDPNQAIYRFRRGEPRLFDWVKEEFKGKIEEQTLNVNYRSTEQIITFVNSIFSEYGKMQGSGDNTGWVRVDNIGEFDKKEQGMEGMYQRLIEIIKDLGKKDYQHNDIGILVRTNQSARDIGDALLENGIPVRAEYENLLVSRPEIRDIIAFLKFIDNPEDDFSLAQVLLSPIFGLTEDKLLHLTSYISHPPAKVGRRRAGPTIYLALIDKYPEWNITKTLKDILNTAGYLSPYETLSLIYQKTEIFNKYQTQENLVFLLKAAYDIEKKGYISLIEFMDYIENTSESIPEIQKDGVRILTVHKAKGLEFPVVILPDTVWRFKTQENRWFVFDIKDNLRGGPLLQEIYWRKCNISEEMLNREKQRIERDELNNLYVALTRAIQGLWIIGFKTKRIKDSWFEFITSKVGSGYSTGEIKSHPVSTGGGTPIISEPVTLPKPMKLKLKKERTLFSPTIKETEITSRETKMRMKRGELIHKALSMIQWLDERDIEKLVEDICSMFHVSCSMFNVFLSTLTDKSLRFIFYKDNRKIDLKKEVPIYFEKGNKDISCIIDRLLICGDRVIIVDYKTGEEDTDPPAKDRRAGKYKKQMKIYEQGIKKIFPDKTIESYLIWVDKDEDRLMKMSF